MGWTQQTHHPVRTDARRAGDEHARRAGGGRVRARSLLDGAARNRSPPRAAVRRPSACRPRPEHARGHRRRPWTGVRVSARTPTCRAEPSTKRTSTSRCCSGIRGSTRAPGASATIGGHVDLAPTIADLAGCPAAADWQGRSLFDAERLRRAPTSTWPRTISRSACARRTGSTSSICAKAGEELYDLSPIRTSSTTWRRLQPERSARLRQRLAAWTEANRRQYERRAH